MDTVLQSHLPDGLWTDPRHGRLPGIGPAAPHDWIHQDEAFAGQMRLRDQLIAGMRKQVIAACPGHEEPTEELLEVVLTELAKRPGYAVGETGVVRPDCVCVALNRNDPFGTIGRLCQEDFCLLQKTGDEHVLTGAVLCFPASWMLSEKIGRPLRAIHAPVAPYDPMVARRVQRLFDALRPGTVLARANLLLYHDAALFQPRSMHDRRPQPGTEARFVRSERQYLLRLPRNGAVVFSIHTCVVARETLPPVAMDQLTAPQAVP